MNNQNWSRISYNVFLSDGKQFAMSVIYHTPEKGLKQLAVIAKAGLKGDVMHTLIVHSGRCCPEAPFFYGALPQRKLYGLLGTGAVSYTHLTLPTRSTV